MSYNEPVCGICRINVAAFINSEGDYGCAECLNSGKITFVRDTLPDLLASVKKRAQEDADAWNGERVQYTHPVDLGPITTAQEKPRFPWAWFLVPFNIVLLVALIYAVWFRK